MKEKSGIRRIRLCNLFLCWIITTILVCIGLLLNSFRDKTLARVDKSKAECLQRSGSKFAGTKTVNAVSSQLPLLKDVPLDDFQAYVKEKRGIILDARPEIFYRFGHVPGALSLPRDEFEKGYTLLKAKLEANKNRPMIIYCSDESCEDSELVHKALANLGYTQISIFRGGWDTWTKAGLPEEK